MKRLFWGIVIVGSIQVAAIVIVSMLLSIYPGVFKLTAPVLCPDDRPDALVVRYETRSSDGGTGTNFTLFCLDDRGQFVEVGSWRPLGLVFGAVSVGLMAAVLVLVAIGRLRRSRAAPPPGLAVPVPSGPVPPGPGPIG